MSFSFNSQIKKLKDKVDTTEYTIQITTDNKEQYLFMQEMARQCVDGNHKEKQGDTKTFNDYYINTPGHVPSGEGYINLPDWGHIMPDAQTNSNIPNCCKNCSNHPSNGGSGVCNCTLPYFENSITSDIINLKITKAV